HALAAPRAPPPPRGVEQLEVAFLLFGLGPLLDTLSRSDLLAVAHLVAAFRDGTGDVERLAARADLLAPIRVPDQLAEKVVIERVLGALVAAEVTVAAERAGTPRAMVKVVRVHLAGVIEQRHSGLGRCPAARS